MLSDKLYLLIYITPSKFIFELKSLFIIFISSKLDSVNLELYIISRL